MYLWIRISPSQETQRIMIEIAKHRNEQNTHKLWNKTVERVSMIENFWHSSFFRDNPLTNLSLFMEKIWPVLFLENVSKTQPLPPIYKGGEGSIMVVGLKCLKIMQFQRNVFHFKGLNLPYKMIRRSMQAQKSITNSWFNCNFTVNLFAVNSYISIKDWKLKIYWW